MHLLNPQSNLVKYTKHRGNEIHATPSTTFLTFYYLFRVLNFQNGEAGFSFLFPQFASYNEGQCSTSVILEFYFQMSISNLCLECLKYNSGCPFQCVYQINFMHVLHIFTIMKNISEQKLLLFKLTNSPHPQLAANTKLHSKKF